MDAITDALFGWMETGGGEWTLTVYNVMYYVHVYACCPSRNRIWVFLFVVIS